LLNKEEGKEHGRTNKKHREEGEDHGGRERERAGERQADDGGVRKPPNLVFFLPYIYIYNLKQLTESQKIP
jgi:hypothetical protein